MSETGIHCHMNADLLHASGFEFRRGKEATHGNSSWCSARMSMTWLCPRGGRLDGLEAAARLGAAEVAHSFGGTVIREGHQKDGFIFTDRVVRCLVHEAVT